MTRFARTPLHFAASDRTADDVPKSPLPDIHDLSQRIRFSPNDGEIWLDDQRVVLLNIESLVEIRRQLVEALGVEAARDILFNAGHAAGVKEAVLALKLRRNQPSLDAFLVGPQLHALRGEVHVEPDIIDTDVEAGHYYSVLTWRNSAEAQAHVSCFGGSADPVCWMQVGYASGYTSGVMGRSILFREIDCAAAGGPCCRIIGRTLEEWAEVDKASDQTGMAMLRGRAHVNDSPTVAEGVVGASSSFKAAWHLVSRVAPLMTTVLLQGETGVGKEVFARAIHSQSNRADRKLFSVNCAAIPENLMDAALFGTERGSFTGSVGTKEGWFEAAQGSTLFLDEIGSLSLTAQAKLLRALQEREITRIGSTQTLTIDVRVICATNVDLETAVEQGEFRADLLHRLGAFPITIPPLRDRKGDIPPLVELFLERFRSSSGRRIEGLTAAAIDALLLYDFPGNIRELENMIARAAILTEDGEAVDTFHLFSRNVGLQKAFLTPKHNGMLASARLDRAAPDQISSTAIQALLDHHTLDDIENAVVEEAMRINGGNVSSTARTLGITRAQLRGRLTKSHKKIVR